MLTITYPSLNSYTVDTTDFDSDYLKSITSLDGSGSITLDLFEDILKLAIKDDRETLFTNDPEYLFRGLSYFGCNSLLMELFTRIKNCVYKQERLNIQHEIERYFETSGYLTNKFPYHWCSNTSLTEDFFQKHLDKVYWVTMSKNTSLSEEFFKNNLYHSDMVYLCANTSLSDSFFQTIIDRCYGNDISWYTLCKNPSISEQFFERHIQKVNWVTIWINPSISEAFVEKYIKKVNWSSLCRNPSISEAFFTRYFHRIKNNEQCLFALCLNPSVSEEFIDKLEVTDGIILSVCYRTPFARKFIERHIDRIDFNVVSKNTSIPEDFIEKYRDRLNWLFLSEIVSEKIALKYIDRIWWNLLCINKRMSEKFFIDHFSLIPTTGYTRLAENPSISISFFDKYLKNVDKNIHVSIYDNTTPADILLWSSLFKNNFNIDKKVEEVVKNKQYYSFDKMWKD